MFYFVYTSFSIYIELSALDNNDVNDVVLRINVSGDMYSRQNTGSGAPGSSSSSAKTPDYTGYSAYSNYADTTYPQRSYQGGESNQGGYAASAPKPGQQGFDFKEWPTS